MRVMSSPWTVGMRTEAAHNEDMEETDIAVGWDVHWIDITGYSEAIMEVISNEYNLPRTVSHGYPYRCVFVRVW